jgi:hypothetical protein
LIYGSKEDADSMFVRFKSYVLTRAETKFRQEYPLESFAGNLGDFIFGRNKTNQIIFSRGLEYPIPTIFVYSDIFVEYYKTISIKICRVLNLKCFS